MKIRYPRPLQKGDAIAITAPSSGVGPEHHPRLDLVQGYLRAQGFEVVEGKCLRSQTKHVSASKRERAQEFLRFWRDPSIRAIMPPWGGEILVEILPLLDFAELANLEPKWISGFSDVSTLLFPLTTMARVATLHGSNLMDLSPRQSDPLTTSLMDVFRRAAGSEFSQNSSEFYQGKWADFATDTAAPLHLTEKTSWKNLRGEASAHFSGRIIGGCLDTIARLVGTPYADLPRFRAQAGSDGVVFYFENCELAPCELARTLWNIRLAGWFEGISGILIGRSSGPEAKSEKSFSYKEALDSVLDELPVPILYDVDLGHRPPNLNIVNGSLATVEFASGKGILHQSLS